MTYVFALLIGVVAGLRTLTPLAAVSWAAWARALPLGDTLLAFLGWRWTPWIITALALGELVTDQLPGTPSRKVPVQFAARLLMGAVCAAAVALPSGHWLAGLGLGVIGAVAGTLGGAAARNRMASAFGSDRPAALIEDAVAIVLAIAIVCAA